MPTGIYCPGCPNQAHGVRHITFEGTGSSGIMLVGDSPWKDEIAKGHPFAGAAGAFLERCLRRLGYDRSAFWISNSMWCMPRHLGWTDHAHRYPEAALSLAQCRPYLDDLIEKLQPRVIVTLGGVAMSRLLGVDSSELENRQAYLHRTPYGYVIPSWHPSFLMQDNQKLTPCLLFALRKAWEVAHDGAVYRGSVTYHLDNYDAIRGYLLRGLEHGRFPHLTVDIETPESGHLDEESYDESSTSYQIIRCGFSHTPGTACSFPWTEPFISLAKKVLALADITIMWNQQYDAPRLRAADCSLGEIHDGMWAWHFLQSDLRKGLGFVAPFYYDGEPWKHLSDAQPAFYNATDNDATLRCYLGIRAALEREGRWDRFYRHCVRTLPILETMGKRGIRVDYDKQQLLKHDLEAERDREYAKLQTEAPDAIRPRKIYRKPPADKTVVEANTRPCPKCGGSPGGTDAADLTGELFA